MERGPLALFGAIVAVGLGPAMWLGAQFATIVAVPSTGNPAAVSSQRPGTAQPNDGGGAGAAPDTPSVGVRPTQSDQYRPMRDEGSASPSPHPRTTTASAATTPSRTTPPASSVSSAPPTESGATSGPPTGGSDVPPSPPPTSATSDSAPAV